MKTVASMKSTCPLHNLWYYSTREHAVFEMDKRTEFINNIVSQQDNLFLQSRKNVACYFHSIRRITTKMYKIN